MRQISDLRKFSSVHFARQNTVILDKTFTAHPVHSQLRVKVINHYEALAFVVGENFWLFRVDTIAHQASRAGRSLVDAVLDADMSGNPQAWFSNELPVLMQESAVRIAHNLEAGDRLLVDGDTYEFKVKVPTGKRMRPTFSLVQVDVATVIRDIDAATKKAFAPFRKTAKRTFPKAVPIVAPSGK